ncbi:hypothetical protein D1872_233460 [compost metagenome]
MNYKILLENIKGVNCYEFRPQPVGGGSADPRPGIYDGALVDERDDVQHRTA